MNEDLKLQVPKFNEETDVATLQALIRSQPFGAWSTVADNEIVINHIPFVLHPDRGELGTLVGHVARSNKIWSAFSTDISSIVVFQGYQAYISPSWYPSQHEHGKAVPTWNYIVVHAHGIPSVIDDREWLLQHVSELTDIHESDQPLPWKVSDAPKEYIDQMLGAIVGIEIPISKLNGKWKLGQNRPEPDKLSMIAGLMSSPNAQAQGLATEISRHVYASKNELPKDPNEQEASK
ncbi:MAG: transcriptional regulator [Gammaproteobacteria bacterium]|jgi:transcriptional regulator